MKIGLINREKLYALGQSLVDELDSLVARIRASWNIEHTPDGAHGNVTADTISVGRLTFSDILQTSIEVAQVDNYDPGFSTAALLRLHSSLDEVLITGLKVPQDASGAVLDGRVLVLENITDRCTFVLSHEDTHSSPRNRIIAPVNSGFVHEVVTQRFYLRPASLLILIYNATKARWVLHSQVNEAITHYQEFSGTEVAFDPGPARTYHLVSPTAGSSIASFGRSYFPPESVIKLTNAGLYTIDLLHASSGADEKNRIYCPGGVRYRLHPRESVELTAATGGGWHIIQKADQWVDVTFDAGDFDATGGAGTPSWTVEKANVRTFSYHIDGNKMTVSLAIDATTVAGGPTSLRIRIPNGRRAARTMYVRPAVVIENGAAAMTPQMFTVAGDTHIYVQLNAAGTTAWANSTTATYVWGQITFMVQDDVSTIDELHTDVAHGDTAHADTDHSDVAHIDTAHSDTHTDTAHADSSHGDIAHVDVSHSDTPHGDTAHADSHSDVSHEDVSHEDVSHEDTPHADTQHEDVSHEDIAHSDEGENVLGLHQDSTAPHVDHIDDPFVPHYDHDDGPHLDTAHEDVDHADTSHTDTSHTDTAHEDVAHEDVAHEDVAHSDTAHSDTAHADSHTDSTHSDTAHGDSHLDSPHLDTAHTDQSHGDTVHADSAHGDVGYHTDSAHTDQ